MEGSGIRLSWLQKSLGNGSPHQRTSERLLELFAFLTKSSSRKVSVRIRNNLHNLESPNKMIIPRNG
jgi:hypothetical protein